MRHVIGCSIALLVLTSGCSAATSSTAGPQPGAQSSAQPRAQSAPPSGAQSSAPAGPVGAGAGTPDGRGPRFMIGSDGAHTSVQALDRGSGVELGSATLAGRWALPALVGKGNEGVAPEGITPSGSHLVLVAAESRSTSRFAVLPGSLATPAHVVVLPAGFGYDAISPDGARLYLIEALPPAGSDHYQVRSYDLAAGRLEDGIVVDKVHFDELMAGHPTSRVTSPDGAVVATLYERTTGTPFIHVLHTLEVRAQCIDLPPAARGGTLTQLSQARLGVRDRAGAMRYVVDPAADSVTAA